MTDAQRRVFYGVSSHIWAGRERPFRIVSRSSQGQKCRRACMTRARVGRCAGTFGRPQSD